MVNAAHALAGLPAALVGLMSSYTYLGIFLLMLLGSACLPVPSEIVLPVTGALAAAGLLNVWLGIAVAIVGSIIGIMIDYYIAYFVGKDIVYKHLKTFHIKKATIDEFDAWFRQNGPFAVCVSRLIPVVRGLINFPAGFALMPKRQFVFYSLVGTVIWDVSLVFFGYYALSTRSLSLLFTFIAAFAIVLYLIYVFALRRIRTASRK